MTAPTDNNDSNSNDLSAEELDKVFEDWDSKKDDFVSVPGGDVELTPEELMLDHERAKTPEAIAARSRVSVRNRLILLVILASVGTLTLVANRSEFAFFFTSSDELIKFGDLRDRWIDKERPGDGKFPTLAQNSWIEVENAIPTEERESETGTYFFFEPILKTIVVTTRSLPEKNPRNMSMHGGLVDLVNARWIFPADLSVSFSGRGRLIKASNAPRRYQGVIRLYQKELRLVERMKMDDLWLLLDGVEPGDQGVYIVIYGMTLFILCLSLWFYLRARKTHEELLERLNKQI